MLSVDSDSDDNTAVDNRNDASDVENSPVKTGNRSRLVDSDDEAGDLNTSTGGKAKARVSRIVDSDED